MIGLNPEREGMGFLVGVDCVDAVFAV